MNRVSPALSICLRQTLADSALHSERPIERPILDRFTHMPGGIFVRRGENGNSAETLRLQ